MNDQTPKLITEDEFNAKVRGWSISTRGRMASKAPVYSGSDSKTRASKKLSQSVIYSLKMEFGSASRIRFSFERHGVFVQYGVGRGYIRQGNSVIKGSRKGEKIDVSKGINRHPVDWFDIEIRQGLAQLADITQEYYGDLALRLLLSKLSKFLIQKT